MKFKLERDENSQLLVTKKPSVSLPRSVYNSRFPSFFGENTHLPYNTYHRSAHKKLDGVKSVDYTFLGNHSDKKKGMYPKIGNFHNPFKYPKYYKAVTARAIEDSKAPKAVWYDKLLNFQKASAKYVVKNVHVSDRMLLNADHDYPCVLFSLNQPEAAEKNIKIWTNFLSIYFIAICNKLAAEKGLNIEMVRRSSFDAVRPSVAECGKSLRISLGLTPRAYHRCVAMALGYLDKLFENTATFEMEVDPTGTVQKMLDNYNTIKSSNVKLQPNLWKSLWANGDSKNRSFATQIFRHEHVVEWIIDETFAKFGKKKLNKIFESDELKKACFAKPLVDFFASLHCDNDKLSTHLINKELRKFSWSTMKSLDDEVFWTFIKDYGNALGADEDDINKLFSSKNLGELYQYLECWLANFTFNPRDYKNVLIEDGDGSDSETEDTVPLKSKKNKISSKKFITATGMRAIQLSFAVAKKFLEDIDGMTPAFITVNADKMYYETSEAIESHAIEYPIKYTCATKDSQKVLNFFDINHCNARQLAEKKNLVEVDKNDKICILDITSATTAEIAKNIMRIWKKAPQLKVIITVSSGLKNEQAMSDYNPYGTIRIFARSKDDCSIIYNQLKIFENDAKYKHPKCSHLLRKNAKDAGFTPTNKAILEACQSLRKK